VKLLEECPHCKERTEIEVPREGHEGEETVEYQQDCDFCAMPIVAVFKVEYVLEEVREA
jgi:hypothetical protein